MATLKCDAWPSRYEIDQCVVLTGIGVNKDDVDSAATLVGCSTFYPPFHYLGVKAGASMTTLNSWKEFTTKISSRLSKWKLKTLSIGGRLTLLKSVLTAIPIYHMSLYKVPVGILNDMESIRRDFFNGIEKSKKKMVWISWETILASKKNRGLGVSSFFSTNRSFLFKWIWRFLSQDSSLWSRFIQAIHGERGAIDNKNSFIKDMALPPREQRHRFLRYEGLEYTDSDIADFESSYRIVGELVEPGFELIDSKMGQNGTFLIRLGTPLIERMRIEKSMVSHGRLECKVEVLERVYVEGFVAATYFRQQRGDVAHLVSKDSKEVLVSSLEDHYKLLLDADCRLFLVAVFVSAILGQMTSLLESDTDKG
ncbi:hypothetical protein Tco_0457629 [Tanacetum coccineum]